MNLVAQGSRYWSIRIPPNAIVDFAFIGHDLVPSVVCVAAIETSTRSFVMLPSL